MTILIAGLVIFFAVHSVSIVNEPWRDRMVAKLGANGWRGIYSLVSLVGFALLVWGYGLARQDPLVLYTPPLWLRPVASGLLLFVFPLLLAAYMPGRIKAVTRHPMLAAVKIWAFAHLLTNGALADVLLFGSFLTFAVVDRISVKRRKPRAIATLPESAVNDILAIVVGLGLFAAFYFWLHASWIGVALR